MAQTRRFPRGASNTRRGGRYGRAHQLARAAAAERHDSSDPCARCRKPLGPMSPQLHYDHDERGGYLGFSHANCNRRAGASKGGKVTHDRWGEGTRKPRICSTCQTSFIPRTRTQRTCSTACSIALRTQAHPRPPQIKPVRHRIQSTLNTCPICGALFATPRKYCSATCMSEANARISRDRYRRSHGKPVDPMQPTRPHRRLAV